MDGQEALEHVTMSEDRFDFILLDLSMPVMNGYEACQSIVDFYQEEQQLMQEQQSSVFQLSSSQDQQSERVIRGKKLLELFERIGKQPVLVALSALITNDIREKCQSVGFAEVLESPLTIQKIQVILKKVQANRQIKTDLENQIGERQDILDEDKSISRDDNPSLKIPVNSFKLLNTIKPATD